MSAESPLEHVSVAPNQTNGPAPAVILLHGRGAHERDLLPIAEQLPGDAHVIAFRAPTPLGPGYTWYDLDLSGGGLHSSQPDLDDLKASIEMLSDSLELAIEEYNLDPERIGLLGFSQGAILSISLMVEYPGRFAWVVALHGYLPGHYEDAELANATGTPIFLGGGTRDEIIPVSRVESAANRLSASGVDTTFNSYPVGHGTSPDELADVKEWLSTRADLD